MIKRWEVDSELDFMKSVCSLSGELGVGYSFSYYDNREGKDKDCLLYTSPSPRDS